MRVRIDEPGLSGVLLANGFVIRESEYGHSIRYERIDEMLDAVALALVAKPARLTSGEFRWLRRKIEVSQEQLAVIVDRDPQTISLIERGKSPPALIDRELRRVAAARLPNGERALGQLSELIQRTSAVGGVTFVGTVGADGWTFRAIPAVDGEVVLMKVVEDFVQPNHSEWTFPVSVGANPSLVLANSATSTKVRQVQVAATEPTSTYIGAARSAPVSWTRSGQLCVG